jgi:hypothetical protein
MQCWLHAIRSREADMKLSLLALTLLAVAGVVLAEWEPAVRLTYDDSISYQTMGGAWDVAISGSAVHVAWYDRRDGGYEIYYKRSDDYGTNWGPDTRMTSDTVYSGYPAIAASGQSVHLCWVQGIDARGDSHDQIQYRRSTDGGVTWEPQVQLSGSTGGYYGGWFPCVAVEGANVHVAWEDDREGDDRIFYRRSTNNGLSWGFETNLRTSLGTVNASLAVSGPNLHLAFHHFWQEVVYYKRSTDNGVSWEPESGIPTPDVSDAPCVAAEGANVHLVFCDGRNNHWDVWYRRSTDNGATWSVDTCIMPDIYQTWLTNIAVAGSDVHVVRGDMGSYQVRYTHSPDNGLTWEPETCLSYGQGGDCYHYSVAASESIVHAVWDQRVFSGPENYEIFYRRNPDHPIGLDGQAKGDRRVANRASIVRGVLNLQPAFGYSQRGDSPLALLDASGREVMGLRFGENDVSRLPPGIYFCRPESGSAQTRLVIVR